MEYKNKIIHGNCGEVLKEFEPGTVDLIITSPPYADRRMKTYGGVKPEEYVGWFLPLADQFRNVLKPEGTFILNIKEQAENGERQTYLMKLVLAMKDQGWLWTEEFIWHKKNCVPGKWPNRFRDAWEHCYQFNKEKKFAMYQDAVRVPIGSWAKSRLTHLSETDKKRDDSKVNSGFGKNVSNWIGRDTVYPTNVIETDDMKESIAHMSREDVNALLCEIVKSGIDPMPTNVLRLATECGNKSHSAAFPMALPEWFIKLFTREGDLVLDPFNGSGTTTLAAHRLGRVYCGIDQEEKYKSIAEERIRNDGRP